MRSDDLLQVLTYYNAVWYRLSAKALIEKIGKLIWGCCSETTFRGKRYFLTLRTKLSITIKIFTTMSEERKTIYLCLTPNVGKDVNK